MPDADISTATPSLIGRIAGAIRQELDQEIDAYPGCRSPERADPLNRAFRAVVRTLIEGDSRSPRDLTAPVSLALGRLAKRPRAGMTAGSSR
ncbi:hypothetical protein P12x_006153 (plasmid) [Tundrisphaera lichenicola]|uniref:hypothetical protein n=1 Tax=Tundrisphaera lichenicola TaxID=2029860 RepID=UPI003EB6F25F